MKEWNKNLLMFYKIMLRIIQVQVNSGINNNLVPIKSSLIKVQAPKISDKYPEVLINANNILATNAKITRDE